MGRGTYFNFLANLSGTTAEMKAILPIEFMILFSCQSRSKYCNQSNVTAAYHQACEPCRAERDICAKCLKPKGKDELT
jgi:hypothetical protein